MRTIPTVALIGNPNVGKSALFSRLTGTKVITSNFPGTTLSVNRSTLEAGIRNKSLFDLVDIPGVYSLTEETETARRGARFVIEHADIIVNVIDATNLKRNLFLSMQLLQLGKPLIIVLNMWDEAKYHGINIDTQLLSKEINAPVVTTVSISGQGVPHLVSYLRQINIPDKKPKPIKLKRQGWKQIQAIVDKTVSVTKRSKNPLEHLATLSLHPFWGTLIALSILVATFTSIFYLSNSLEGMIGQGFTFFFTKPLIALHELLTPLPFLQSFLIGTVSDGIIDFEAAMGLLTTGIYIPLGQVAPPVTAFYLVMGLLEDCGYLPRLAILADTLMHHYALHGFALVPMLLGAGCNVTGIVGTRVLENRRQRIITAALLSITVPCASQTGFIVAMSERMGSLYTAFVFVTLAVTWHILGTILGKREKHNYQELIVEIPPFRCPRLTSSAHKLLYRTRNFLSDAIPITIAGIGVLLILNYFSVFELLGNTVFSFLHTIWGLPSTVIPALFMGLFRKEIALSYLKVIPNLSAAQSFISTLLLTLWFPCISVYTILYKEFGLRVLGWMVLLMFGSSTTIALLAHMLIKTFA